MIGQRLSIAALAAGGVVLLGIAVLMFVQARSFLAASEVGRGVVTSLNDGPRHAIVEFRTHAGRQVSYQENNAPGPLAVGQSVAVRYRAEAPADTAVVDGPPFRSAWRFAIAGIVMLIAALVSPWLTTRFPGLLGFPTIR